MQRLSRASVAHFHGLVGTLIAILLLTGCAQTKNPGTSSTLQSQTERGLILGSVTFAPGPATEYQLFYEQRGGADLLGVAQPGGFVALDTSDNGGGDPELFALELPAGEYVFTSWRINQGRYRVWPKEDFAIPFVVKANQTTYVGNFDFQELKASEQDMEGNVVTFEDRFDRDLERFTARYQDMDLGTVEVGLEADAAMSWEKDATKANRSFVVFFTF